MLESRKWKAVLIDAIVAILSYWATNILAPEYSQHVLFLIGALQPVVITYIGGVAYEDAASKSRIGSSVELGFAQPEGDDEAPVR